MTRCFEWIVDNRPACSDVHMYHGLPFSSDLRHRWHQGTATPCRVKAMRVCPLPHARVVAASAAILGTASCLILLHVALLFEVSITNIIEKVAVSERGAGGSEHRRGRSSLPKLAIGADANSCAAVGDPEDSDKNGQINPENGTGNGDAAVERRRARDEERLGLVALEPGHDVGPYRLQEHLGYLGSRPVHALDPAFHPYEVKRVAYYAPGMLSAPPLPMCQAIGKPSPWHAYVGERYGQEEGAGAGLVLPGGVEDMAGEGSYRLKRRFEGGSHGEVWRAVRIGPDGQPVSGEGYVLKRMLLEKGQHVMQAGVREIYFGELLRGRRGSPRVARYVEHLYLFGDHKGGRFGTAGEGHDAGVGGAGGGAEDWDEGVVPSEMWLVFHDEGVSLRHYLYTEREAEGFVLHGQSAFWRDMRLDPKGPEVMKSLLRQTLEGTQFLHSKGILHRDLKPSNLIVSLPPTVPNTTTDTKTAETSGTTESRGEGGGVGTTHHTSPGSAAKPVASWAGRGWAHSIKAESTSNHGKRKRRRGGDPAAGKGGGGGGDDVYSSPVLLKVADFSSAVDEGAMAAGLYGAVGPAQAEETLQYAPPEVLFNPETAYSAKRPESYDAWSIGVILLEMILGTPEVFTVDQRTRAILDRDLAFEDDAVRKKAYLLAAMADMCIYSRPGYGGQSAAGKPSTEGTHGQEHTDHGTSDGGGDGGGVRSSSRHGTQGVLWPLGDRAVVDERCTLAELGKAVHTRDALDIGFSDQWGLDLLWRLLRWDPLERISVADALEHAYFVGPYRSRRDGSVHATRREAMTYDGWFIGSVQGGSYAITSKLPSPPHTTLWGNAPPRASSGVQGFNSMEGLWEAGDEGKLVPATSARERGSEFMLDTQHSLVGLHYSCPKCTRTFELWRSCHNHVTGRDHAAFCHYDTTSLPPCVSSHSMLPFDPHSGWCDVQGRRSRIEDYHSIVFQEDYKFYGVFDGHCGTRAAKFASRALHVNLELFLNAAQASSPMTFTGRNGLYPRSGKVSPADTTAYRSRDRARGDSDVKARIDKRVKYADREQADSASEDMETRAAIERAVRAAFRKTQDDFLELTSSSAAPNQTAEGPGGKGRYPKEDGGVGGADEESGTTATVALVYPHITVVAHVGDSRAVMCCDELGNAVDITEDHTPYSDGERARVEANGGSVELRGVLRVNGELAVTRTIGNRRLNRHGVLSSEPDVTFISHGGTNAGRGGGSGDERTYPRGFAHDGTRVAAERHVNEEGSSGGVLTDGDGDGDGDADGRSSGPSSGRNGHGDVVDVLPDGRRAEDESSADGDSDEEKGNNSSNHDRYAGPSFLVLASDGLWDVVSSQEAVTMVNEVILGATNAQFNTQAPVVSEKYEESDVAKAGPTAARGRGQRDGSGSRRQVNERLPRDYGSYGAGQAFQMAATALTHEAYVRGSTDNIGVCVVDLRPH